MNFGLPGVPRMNDESLELRRTAPAAGTARRQRLNVAARIRPAVAPGGQALQKSANGGIDETVMLSRLALAFPRERPARLQPFFGVLLSPITAGVAMSLSSVSAITNALRLRRVRL